MPDDTTLEGATQRLSKIPYTAPAGSDDAPPEQPESQDPPAETPDEGQTDAAPQETAPSGEETTQAPEPAEPPIELPASWKAEAQEHWSKLPRDLQEIVSRREQERDTELRRRQSEFAEFEKTRDTHLTQAQQYAQHLQSLVQQFQTEIIGTEFADIKTPMDVAKLAKEDPARYLEWDARTKVFMAAQQALHSEQQRQASEGQAAQRKWIAEQEQKLVRLVPEWRDAERAKKEIGEVAGYILASGITEDQLRQNPPAAEAWIIARKAMLYDKAQKAKTAAQVQNLPKVVKPGTTPARDEGKHAKIAALKQQLAKTGDYRDAARLLAAGRGVI